MRHLQRVFIPNVVLTVNASREGDEIHCVVLEDGSIQTADGMQLQGLPARLAPEWDYLGVTRAVVIQAIGDSPAMRQTIHELIELHRAAFGTASLHTEGSGSLVTWADGGAIPPLKLDVEDGDVEGDGVGGHESKGEVKVPEVGGKGKGREKAAKREPVVDLDGDEGHVVEVANGVDRLAAAFDAAKLDADK